MTIFKTLTTAAILIAVTALAAFAATTPRTAPAKSSSVVSISLPGDLGFAFKPGSGANLANALCLSCHSQSYVATQPPFGKAVWTAEILKMRNVYGAKINDDQVAPLAEYLTANYGTP